MVVPALIALTGAGWVGLGVYLTALLLVYPLYSWWSLLVEHRWFVQPDPQLSRTAYECTVARRTLYGPISGAILRYLVCPLTDGLHLAHHLYPRLHWTALRYADLALAQTNEQYASGATDGFLIRRDPSRESAISDLSRRLVRS